MNEITNTQDIIDSRDVIERIDEIENSFPDTCEHCGEGLDSLDDFIEFKFDFVCQDCKQPLDFDQDDVDELKALKDLAEQCEGSSPDWKYGGALRTGRRHRRYWSQCTLADLSYRLGSRSRFLENGLYPHPIWR